MRGIDSEHGLACCEICVKQVELMGRLLRHNAKSIANSQKMVRMANRQARSMSIFGIVMGVLFLGFGGLSYKGGNNFGALMLGGMGALFLGHGLVKLSSERYPEPDDESTRDKRSGQDSSPNVND